MSSDTLIWHIGTRLHLILENREPLLLVRLFPCLQRESECSFGGFGGQHTSIFFGDRRLLCILEMNLILETASELLTIRFEDIIHILSSKDCLPLLGWTALGNDPPANDFD